MRSYPAVIAADAKKPEVSIFSIESIQRKVSWSSFLKECPGITPLCYGESLLNIRKSKILIICKWY